MGMPGHKLNDSRPDPLSNAYNITTVRDSQILNHCIADPHWVREKES